MCVGWLLTPTRIWQRPCVTSRATPYTSRPVSGVNPATHFCQYRTSGTGLCTYEHGYELKSQKSDPLGHRTHRNATDVFNTSANHSKYMERYTNSAVWRQYTNATSFSFGKYQGATALQTHSVWPTTPNVILESTKSAFPHGSHKIRVLSSAHSSSPRHLLIHFYRHCHTLHNGQIKLT